MKPHVAVITLGVEDLKRARKFYNDGLGWPIQQEDYNRVCFSLGDGSSALALYPWGALANDANARSGDVACRNGLQLLQPARESARGRGTF